MLCSYAYCGRKGCDSNQFWPRGDGSFIVIGSGNLAPSSSFSFAARYAQVFKQVLYATYAIVVVLVFIQNFQGSKALQETFLVGARSRPHCPCISHSMPFLPQASAESTLCFSFWTMYPQEKPEKEAFVTELRDFETCPDAAHWRLEGPKGWAMLLEITETIDPYCTNPCHASIPLDYRYL